MIAQVRVPKDRLPEEMKRLADPNLPLCHPESFIPLPTGGGWLSVSIFVACCLGCTLLVPTIGVQSFRAITGTDYVPSDLWLALLFFAFLVSWAIRQLYLIRIGNQRRREQTEGRYRIGLFFESAYLLVVEEKWATIIPRECIMEITYRAADHVESGAQAKGTYIEIIDHEGQQRSQWVPNSSRAQHIRTWLETGKGIE